MEPKPNATSKADPAEKYMLRRDARKLNNLRTLVLRIADLAELSEWEAQQAAVTTLCVLEHRLQPDEARQLNAQLPVLLRELIQECGVLPPPRDIDKISLLQRVSRSLDCEEWESEPIVRAVFAAIREKISAGEYDDVAAQLPRPLKTLWMSASSAHLESATSEDAFIKRDDENAAHDFTSGSRQDEPARIQGLNDPLPGIGAESVENEVHSTGDYPEGTDSRRRP